MHWSKFCSSKPIHVPQGKPHLNLIGNCRAIICIQKHTEDTALLLKKKMVGSFWYNFIEKNEKGFRFTPHTWFPIIFQRNVSSRTMPNAIQSATSHNTEKALLTLLTFSATKAFLTVIRAPLKHKQKSKKISIKLWRYVVKERERYVCTVRIFNVRCEKTCLTGNKK